MTGGECAAGSDQETDPVHCDRQGVVLPDDAQGPAAEVAEIEQVAQVVADEGDVGGLHRHVGPTVPAALRSTRRAPRPRRSSFDSDMELLAAQVGAHGGAWSGSGCNENQCHNGGRVAAVQCRGRYPVSGRPHADRRRRCRTGPVLVTTRPAVGSDPGRPGPRRTGRWCGRRRGRRTQEDGMDMSTVPCAPVLATRARPGARAGMTQAGGS